MSNSEAKHCAVRKSSHVWRLWLVSRLQSVFGVSDLAADKTYHGVLWLENAKILDLQTLPGDLASAALGINDGGEAVGVSFDASFNPRAFLWRDGRIIDLNQLAPGSPLNLLFEHSINSRGVIVGFGIDSTGDVHAFSAVPCDENDIDQSGCDDYPGSHSTEWPRPSLREPASLFSSN